MRTLNVIMILMALLLSACSKDNDNHVDPSEIVGTWRLIEQLADPGDGSGTFQPVSSQKTIEFFSNGTFSSNGTLCMMSTGSSQASTGTYSTVDSSLSVDNCNQQVWLGITYEMDGSHLILNYPCIEPCRQKYEKIQ